MARSGRRWRFVAPLLLAPLWVICAAGSARADKSSPPPPPTDESVAYQVNPTHDGAQSDPIAPPLTRMWSVDLGGAVSYPLIAQGKAFVTVGSTSTYGKRLYALDLVTGATVWGPVDIGGYYDWSGAAYDNGTVFVLNFNGQLSAFDAGTGAAVWTTQLPGQYAFTSPPTAINGVVYAGGAGSGGTLYAVDEASGAVQWMQSVMNGDHSSPAVSGGSVYVSYACQQAYGFATTDGSPLWHHSTYCEGGGGKTPATHGNGVYVRDSIGNVVLDAATGAEIGTFPGAVIPAFSGSSGFFLNGSTLEAHDLSSGTVTWTFNGDGQLSSAPVTANGYVYVGSATGDVYAVSAADGHVVWSDNTGAAIAAPDEQNAVPLTGLAVGEGNLLVPASTKLVAYSTVPDFSLSAASTVTVSPGQSTTTPVALQANSLFSGSVRLSASGAPIFSSANVSPGTVKLSPGESDGARLTVQVALTQLLDFDVTLEGCGNGTCHSAVVHVHVT